VPPLADGHPHQPQLVDVAADGGLRDLHAFFRQQLDQFGLRGHTLPQDDVLNALLSLVFSDFLAQHSEYSMHIHGGGQMQKPLREQ